jgi:hypothetical protein
LIDSNPEAIEVIRARLGGVEPTTPPLPSEGAGVHSTTA